MRVVLGLPASTTCCLLSVSCYFCNSWSMLSVAIAAVVAFAAVVAVTAVFAVFGNDAMALRVKVVSMWTL